MNVVLIVVAVIVAVILGVVGLQLPEIRRYLKIRSM
jgi:hypothetical protein